MKSLNDFLLAYPIFVIPVRDQSIAINPKTGRFENQWHDIYFSSAIDSDPEQLFFLGLWNEKAVFAWDVPQALSMPLQWETIRNLEDTMDHEEHALAALAMGMARFHRESSFCPSCGSPSKSYQWGEARICKNTQCGYILYPFHISPSMIALICDDSQEKERLLLIRHKDPHRPKWTLPSGFIAMGETIEDAVIREVFEETHISCSHVQYMASQPWPLGKSLMIGCKAKALSTQIQVDDIEVSEAIWVDRSQLLELLEQGKTPPLMSISFQMMAHWLNG